MMRRGALLFAISLGCCIEVSTPASSALDSRRLSEAGFDFTPGTKLPGSALFEGAKGREPLSTFLAGKPALLLFADYRCKTLCDVILDRLAETVRNVPMNLRRDYNVLTVALDDHQTQGDATAYRNQHAAGTPLQKDGLFLTEDKAARVALETSVRLAAPYDVEHRQFAHPVGVIVVDARGRAKQILNPLAVDPLDLKLALTEGSDTPTLAQRVQLLCYGWDPAKGLYAMRIERILSVMATFSVAILVLAITWLLRQERRLKNDNLQAP